MEATVTRTRLTRPVQRGLTLIELLIAMSILTVVTGMILISWFSLQDSFSFSTKSTAQREAGRDAMSRMVRELRDAQGTESAAAIARAANNEVRFYTTFNEPGADNAGVNRLTRYWYDAAAHELIRQRDMDDDGSFVKVGGGSAYVRANLDPGDRVDIMLTHLVNNSVGDGAIFHFAYYDQTGSYVDTRQAGVTTVLPLNLPYVVSIRIHLMIDLNPGKSPTYYDLVSTAQLRNVRAM